ncbi:MAG: hypothetical protein ABIW32_05210 [Terrimesophilobacter sp.]
MSVRTMGRSAAMLAALIVTALSVVFTAPSASALDQPTTPQPVAEYFAEGLVPRLIDLYGAGDGITKGIDFDATTEVGKIERVREWTPDFLAGKVVDDPTRLTNNWVAPVRVRGDVLGLATVWINPADDEPELATFDPAELARDLAAAPKDSWLIHDPARGAWFALTEDGLFPLLSGTSGVTEPLTVASYQRLIAAASPANVKVATSAVPVAALVLGIVVVLVAIFVILPVRRKLGPDSDEDEDEDEGEGEGDDEDEPDPKFEPDSHDEIDSEESAAPAKPKK